MFQVAKPDLLIYHANCLDGWGCRWCVEQKWPNVEMVEANYGDTPPDVRGKRVLIADFSYDEATMRELAAQAAEVTVLDHHDSSQEAVKTLLAENVIRGVHDMDRSGASLTWEAVWGQRFGPKIIEHIQDRDLWKFEIEHTREVTAVLASYGYDFFEWRDVARRVDGGHHAGVHAEGRAILRAKAQEMSQAMDMTMRYMVIGGHRVPVANAPRAWSSEIGHVLAEGNVFAATYYDGPNGRQFSLRTQTKDFRVNDVAAQYGGGGHPGAAGFTAPHGWEGDVDEGELEEITLGGRGQIGLEA